jgi:hypothetical protein
MDTYSGIFTFVRVNNIKRPFREMSCKDTKWFHLAVDKLYPVAG